MKWKKQLCAAAAVLLALGIALAGVLLNQHFLVLSGGISRTEIQSPLGDLVRSHLQLVALIVFATLAAAILALYHYKKQPELRCWPCLCPPNGWCPPRQSFCCWGKPASPCCGSAR